MPGEPRRPDGDGAAANGTTASGQDPLELIRSSWMRAAGRPPHLPPLEPGGGQLTATGQPPEELPRWRPRAARRADNIEP